MAKREIRLNKPIVVFLMALLLMLHIFSPAPPILYALGVPVGLFGFNYLWARKLSRHVGVSRERRYGWAQVGDVIEERFVLTSGTLFPLLWSEIEECSTLPGYAPRRICAVARGETIRWITEGVCQRRGAFTLGPLILRTSDPFGIFSVRIEYPFAESFVVYPPVSQLPYAAMPRGESPGTARASYRALELTTDASSVRPYIPGDALNRIHWRSTARRDDFYVKQFDLQPTGDLWIVLDLEEKIQEGEEEESTEEYGVILAASLGYRMLQEGRAVGLVANGAESSTIHPGRGQNQLWDILRELATASAKGNESLDRVLKQVSPLVGRGMTVVVITPSMSSDWVAALLGLMRRGVSAATVLLDPLSFGGTGDARTMMGTLSDYGVGSQVFERGYQFVSMTPRQRQRPIYRTLATGRVIKIPPEQAVAEGQRP